MQTKTPRFQLAHLGSVVREELVPVHLQEQLTDESNKQVKHKMATLTLIPLAVGTYLVAFKLEKALDSLLVLGCAVRAWIHSTGHWRQIRATSEGSIALT